MKSPEALFATFEALGIPFVNHHHVPVFTVEESETVTHTIAGAHTKNLFVKNRKGNYFLITVPHHKKVDLNTLAKNLGAGRFSFASGDDLVAIMGVKPGSATLLAYINESARHVTCVLDETFLEHRQINCHPLTNDQTTTLAVEDLLRFLKHHGITVTPTAVPEKNAA